MADNYLEKRYERYEARKAAWEKARKHPSLPNKKVQIHNASAPKTTEPGTTSDPTVK